MNTKIPLPADLAATVARALAEDIGEGDLTARLVPAEARATATVITREPMVLCGAPYFDAAMHQVDPATRIEWHVDEGEFVPAKTTLCTITGAARSLLTTERVGLNLLQTLSATATATKRHVDLVAGTRARVIETRKTIPGLRLAQKYAVRVGGGANNRIGLFDGILIKENHIVAAGGIGPALAAARAQAKPGMMVQIEVESLAQLEEAIAAGGKLILLDNFDTAKMAEAVRISGGRAELEASGGIDLTTIREVALTGVDRISIGTLTKDIEAADLSMRFRAGLMDRRKACDRMRLFRFTVQLLALALVAGCMPAPEPATRRGAIEFAECRLKDVANTAWCAEVKVPENAADANGKKIGIHVALMPAYVRSRAPDPLVLLAGGPGQAASDIGKLGLLFDAVRRSRDIVLIDQRGTGKSHPFPCKLFDALDPVVAMMQVAPDPNKLRECIAGFDGDPKQYTTPAFIADLEAVRGALGVDQFNLWGGSYGSRVALAYLKAHPARIRAAIIDGIAPTSMRIFQEALLNGEARLAQTLADCAATPACAAAYPHLAGDWKKLHDDFAQARSITFVHPRSGAPQTLQVDFMAIDGALRTLLYSAEYTTMVPEVIARAAAGDFAPLFAASLRITGDMGAGMNVGLQLSVVCAEDAGRIGAELRNAAAALPLVAAVFGRIDDACRDWPRGSVPAAFHEPTTSDAPVLIFSGGLDPVTPVAGGELAARTLKNATHIVAPGYAHLVSPFSCAPRLVARFVDDGNAGQLPQDCVSALRNSKRPAFFVNRLEAKP